MILRVTKISTVALIALFISNPVIADQEILEVESFSGIEIGVGMIGRVVCGSGNSLTLTGEQRDLDNVKVNINAGVLEISRRSNLGKVLSNILGNDDDRNSTIEVDVTTDGQISNISGSTGSSLNVSECAINGSFLEVEAGTGAVVNVEGSTGTLELELSTGSVFNNRSSGFRADTANIDLSTGASANLCGVGTINGDASTGAEIKASNEANIENVSLSFGAEVRTKRCR